ncbi:MAG: fatty acid kinase fatty acid binding subunit [Clostridia bacterium]|jgi:DegV family protein with EDD domain|nr:fatty acid kinase fatty acid binding subunit [Clostridia bacterium]MDN5323964.1 fatty acid kinase fatty acid binding subunit [Clostridia bacterium]
MSKIRIVTDSTADLPVEIIKEYKITVVPLRVNFGNQSFLEGRELTPNEFYKKLGNSENLPTTSQPSPGDFTDIFEELANENVEEIISIHLSRKLSGTYQSALLAKSLVTNKVKVEVIDSGLVSMGLGLVVLAAARAVQEGKKLQEILNIIHDVKGKIDTFFVVDTLDYLQKGGRIGKASQIVGSLLNIKPILTITNGEVHSFEKIRGKGKALDRLIEIAYSRVPANNKLLCAITHSNNLDTALNLHKKILNKLNCSEIIISDIGSVVGTHVGPGTVAFMYYVI